MSALQAEPGLANAKVGAGLRREFSVVHHAIIAKQRGVVEWFLDAGITPVIGLYPFSTRPRNGSPFR